MNAGVVEILVVVPLSIVSRGVFDWVVVPLDVTYLVNSAGQ